MDPFPEDVKQFLDANVASVEQLEILRILGDNPQKEWPIAALAREVQAQPQTLASHLAALQTRGLLTIEVRGAEAVSRYGPSTPELEVLVRRLLELYRQRPVTMINLVYARARETLRTFAEAFRLRKEE